MALRLITAPTVEPVSLDELKTHLRVDVTEDDSLIYSYGVAARKHIEQEILNRALVNQTWELVLDAFPGSRTIKLPLPPLQSVTSITYYDEDGNSAVVSSSDYLVDTASEPGRIVLKATASWPSTVLQVVNGVVIRFVAGQGAGAANVSEVYKQAIKLMVGDMYENREDTLVAQGVSVVTIPNGVKTLLMGKRVIPV